MKLDRHDKRARFYTMPDLPRKEYEENEQMIRDYERRKHEEEGAHGITDQTR